MAGRPGWNSSVTTIKGVPRARECFWFNVPGSRAPEIPNWHPCVVIRGAQGKNDHRHTVTIVPLTSKSPSVERDDVVRLSRNPNPSDDRPVWALCEFVATVGLFRLEHYTSRRGEIVKPQVSSQDLERILDGVVNGVGLLKRLVEARIQESEARLKGYFDAKLMEFENDFEARVQAAVSQRLEVTGGLDSEPAAISLRP